MGRSIIELDRALRPAKNRAIKARTVRSPGTGVARRTAGPPAAAATGLGLRRYNRVARPRSLGAEPANVFDFVEVKIKGSVTPLRQSSEKTCWATVYTMLYGWKTQQPVTVDTAIARVGARWSALLAKREGILRDQKVDFIADAGLVAELPKNPTIDGWASMIATYGPIWVTTDEDPTDEFSIHARILCAVRGDRTPEGTKLDFIDPGTGSFVTESFKDFLVKYESEAMDPDSPLRVQIVHWPAGAQAFSVLRRAARAASVPPVLLSGAARGALCAALVEHGVSPGDANALIEAFAAEVRGEQQRPVPMSYRRPSAFDTPENRGPEDGDPRETAREILSFFYPERSFGNITDDHVRLAAAMFYAAMAKQEALNLLPDNPGWRPGPTWLAKQAVKIAWRKMNGPKGFTSAVRNAVALQWRTTLEEIENGLPPTALGFGRSFGAPTDYFGAEPKPGMVRTWMKEVETPFDISKEELAELHCDNFVSVRLPRLREMILTDNILDQICEFQYANGKTFSVRLGDIAEQPYPADKLWNDSYFLVVPVDESWRPVLNSRTTASMFNVRYSLEMLENKLRAEQMQLIEMIAEFASKVAELGHAAHGVH
jgi:hypothetical protein